MSFLVFVNALPRTRTHTHTHTHKQRQLLVELELLAKLHEAPSHYIQNCTTLYAGLVYTQPTSTTVDHSAHRVSIHQRRF